MAARRRRVSELVRRFAAATSPALRYALAQSARKHRTGFRSEVAHRLTPTKIAGALCGLLLLAAVAAGQDGLPSQSGIPTETKFTARTELVLIPVVVMDRTGAQVSDLTKDDFTLLEDGRHKEIAFFEHVTTSAGLAKRASGQQNEFSNAVEGGPNRLTIIVLDTLNTRFEEQVRARRELLKFLSESLEATEPICLMAIDQGGIRVIHDFTTEPTVLVEALKKVRAHRSLRETIESDQVVPPAAAGRRVSEEADRLLAFPVQVGFAALQVGYATRTTLGALREIAEAFAGIPGRKSLIWATGGLPFVINDSSRFALLDADLLLLYENTWKAMNRSNIAVYPLDLQGLYAPGFVSPAFARRAAWRFRIADSVSNLETFAEMTGGRMCYRRSDIESCFHEAAKDSADYYLLACYPDSTKVKAGWRKLSVKVRRPGTQVRARGGYFAKGGPDASSAGKLDLELALLSPLEFTALPLTVRWTGVSDNSGKKRIGFEFILTPAALTIDEADNNHLSLDFAAVAKTGAGQPVAQFSKSAEGRLKPETAAKFKARGVKYSGEIELPPGEYTVRFVVRDNLSGRMGTVSAPLKFM